MNAPQQLDRAADQIKELQRENARLVIEVCGRDSLIQHIETRIAGLTPKIQHDAIMLAAEALFSGSSVEYEYLMRYAANLLTQEQDNARG